MPYTARAIKNFVRKISIIGINIEKHFKDAVLLIIHLYMQSFS